MSKSRQQSLKVAVDLDGVLAETMEVWCKRANQEFGKSLKLEDLNTWASWEVVDIPKNDFYRILDEVWDSWRDIPPTEPEIAGKLARIERFGRIDIVTGRSLNTVESVKKWLRYHKVRYENFVRVRGWRDKVHLDYDVFIDDAPELMPLISRSPLLWGILYDRPWNRDVVDMPRVLKAKNWGQMPELLQKIQKYETEQTKIAS